LRAGALRRASTLSAETLSAVETNLANIHAELSAQLACMDRMHERFARFEKQLGPIDA
jgi:hypothetical protein